MDISAKISDPPQARTPPELTKRLKTHQKFGLGRILQWIRDPHSRGGIIADEMGLGKTLMMIAALLEEVPIPDRPALILVPSSLMDVSRKEFTNSTGGSKLQIIYIHPWLKNTVRKNFLQLKDLAQHNAIVASHGQFFGGQGYDSSDSYTCRILTSVLKPRL